MPNKIKFWSIIWSKVFQAKIKSPKKKFELKSEKKKKL